MKKITFICIGSTSLIGDSLGPVIGMYLKQKYRNNKDVKIYGDIYKPVTFKNIDEYFNKIEKDNNIVIIDAALGKEVGNIIINSGSVSIGKALNKEKVLNSDLYIKGIVGLNHSNKIYNYFELKNTQIKIIENLAVKIIRMINV